MKKRIISSRLSIYANKLFLSLNSSHRKLDKQKHNGRGFTQTMSVCLKIHLFIQPTLYLHVLNATVNLMRC